MSSFPLISHRLFVAAVKESRWTPVVPTQTEELAPAPALPGWEIPLELVEFGRSLPYETALSFGALRKVNSTSS